MLDASCRSLVHLLASIALRPEALLPGAQPLTILSGVLVAGALAGSIAARLRLPRVTGQILAGVLIGPYALHLFEAKAAVAGLRPVTHFALGLVAVAVGSHLSLRRLRNAGKRLGLLVAFEALWIPAVVLGALWALTPLGSPAQPLGLVTAALMAAIAIETSPATIWALVREARAKGVFAKTLLASVALSNIACIFLFEVFRAMAIAGGEGLGGLPDALVAAGRELLLALLLGGTIAVLVTWLTRTVRRPDALATASLAAILVCSGVASELGASNLLACLFLGFVQTNLQPSREELIESVFRNFQPAILAVFFTLAGMKLDFSYLAAGGSVAVVLFASRIFAKTSATWFAMHAAGAPKKLRRWLGLARLPQAGVAIGLVLVVQEDPGLAPVSDLVAAIVLTVVTLNEIAGPLLTRLALRYSGEVDRDRDRLLDFIGEENIVTDLEAQSMTEAIEKLTELLISSHHLPKSMGRPLLESTLEREAQVSTVLGGGLAIPHGELPEGPEMLGVLGISRRGLDFAAPDGHPVHCLVLLATPVGQRDRHLEVLATLAGTVGSDPVLQAQLFQAKSPAHAYELLHGERAEWFNYYLEEDADWGHPR